MSLAAAQVVRVKIQGQGFGSAGPHSSGNLLKAGTLVDATIEDQAYFYWCKWRILNRGEKGDTGSKWNVVRKLLSLIKFHWLVQIKKLGINSPVPNSERWNNKNGGNYL